MLKTTREQFFAPDHWGGAYIQPQKAQMILGGYASVYDLHRGCVFLFAEYYEFPKEIRHFMLWHETGHLHMVTEHGDASEEAANRWALNHCQEFFDAESAMNLLYTITPDIRIKTRKRLGMPVS